MTAVADSKHAVQILYNLQAQATQTGDGELEEQMSAIITMLDSPVFQQLLKLQVSIRKLKEHIESVPPGKPIEDYDFSPQGELVFFEPEGEVPDGEPSPVPSPVRHPYEFENKMFEGDEGAVGRMEPAISVKTVEVERSAPPPPSVQNDVEGRDEFRQALQELALGREIHSIVLTKPEGGGLGFSVVGLKSENHGELGIFVQQIQQGGTADRDGRLQESDQILAIDRGLLSSTVSHHEAIVMLQRVKGQVEIMVARGGFSVPNSPLNSPTSSGPQRNQDFEPEEDEMYVETIELYNDGSGLGFGIVGVKDIGIVVKTILEGGTADKDGRLQSGDRILKIGETSLEGMTSDQVAVVLRQSGNRVKLTIARGELAFAPASASRTPVPTEPSMMNETAQDVHASQVPPGLNEMDLVWGGGNSDVFDVELVKGSHGIGITIAGYVTDQGGATHSGIFVKSVAEGSAAHLQGNINVNDQIIEVDGQSLEGFSNVEAVEVLRKTQSVVRLKLARQRDGDDDAFMMDADQEVVAEEQAAEMEEPDLPPVAPPDYPPPDGMMMLGNTLDETGDEDVTFDGDMTQDEEDVIRNEWQSIMGYDVEIVVAQLSKFREGGGLGISLEGTVDIDENGQEVRPHHYIRSILPDGPVGQNGKLYSGDELLEVNGNRLLGLNHVEVVKTLKELPMHVRLVCARHPHPVFPDQEEGPRDEEGQDMNLEVPQAQDEGVITASTEGRLESAPPQTPQANAETPHQNISITKESLAGLAMWSDQPMVIKLMKGDRGLGFSILDYQDPLSPSQTVIVIRSLVPGGVAEEDGRLIPGDRLVSVNDINLEDCSLDMAVGALKGAAPGIVRIGVAKPLPSPSDEQETTTHNVEIDATTDVPHMSMETDGRSPPVEEVVGAAVTMAALESSPMAKSSPEVNPPDLVASATVEPSASELVSTSATPPQPRRKPPTPPPKPILTPKSSNETSSSVGSPERFSRSSMGRRSTVILPEYLERVIVLKKNNAGLGLTVHAEKGNGVVVKSIIRGGVVQQDGRLEVGDYITAVNNASIRNHSNQDARSLIRRCSLDRADKISISYIPASVGASFRDNPSAFTEGSIEAPPPVPTSPVPLLNESAPSDSPDSHHYVTVHPHQADTTAKSPSSGDDIRTVRLLKEPKRSLGISIVGGRNHDGETMRGIFIKHVLPDSPAGRSESLKTGDQILEVNGCDLREATHDQAVAIIRNSTNPVLFKVHTISPGSRD